MTSFRSGNGAAWLDLLSTLSGRYVIAGAMSDSIDSPSTLAEWLQANDLEPVRVITQANVERFASVREALHRATVRAIRNEPPTETDAGIINRALAEDPGLHLELHASGIRLTPPASGSESLARVIRAAVEDLSGPRRTQLRACGDDTCAGLFLDPTGRRRWCTDQSCGNRVRVRAYRARAHQGAAMQSSSEKPESPR